MQTAAEAVDLISPEYQAILRATHAKQSWGRTGHHFLQEVVTGYQELGCSTLLDYGSGRESLRIAIEYYYPSLVKEMVCYDPGIEDRSALPAPADFVVGTDVLEHVEPHLIDNVLDHMDSLMIKGGFLNIALTKAKRLLSDGSNAHLIVAGKYGSYMWLEMLERRSWVVVDYQGSAKRLKVWLRKEVGNAGSKARLLGP